MDSHTLWSSALDSGRNDELVSDSLNGEAATTTATTTAPASVLSGDKAGESDCSPMILDSYTPSSDEGQESSDNGKDGDSHLLDMDHSVDAADRPSEDLSAMFATNEFNGIQLSLSPASASHALASLDPTTLAVANLDDDYWQFIHSDLMATEALNANALQYLSESTSAFHGHSDKHGHSSVQHSNSNSNTNSNNNNNEASTSFSIPIKTEPLSPTALMASTSMSATADPMMGAFFDQAMLPASFYTTDIKPSLLLNGQDDITWLTNMVAMPTTATPASLMTNPSFVPLAAQSTSSSSSTAATKAAAVTATTTTTTKRGRKKRDTYATGTFNTQLQPLKPTPAIITPATPANATSINILPASSKIDGGKRTTNRAKSVTSSPSSSETSTSANDQATVTKRPISRRSTIIGAAATTSASASATANASTTGASVTSPPKLAPALSANTTSASSTPLRPFPTAGAANLLPSLATATSATANTTNSTNANATHSSIANGVSTTNTLAASPADSTLTSFSGSHDEGQIVYDKRQQRLIKNRAAALMSRKRKREHLASLEQQAEELKSDNDQLRMQLAEKESRITAVEQERDDAQQQLNELQEKLAQLQKQLKHSQERHLPPPATNDNTVDNGQDTCNMDVEKDTSVRLYREHNHTNGESRVIKSTSTAGMVFMAIIFSFAILSLPVARITLPLTTGGSSGTGTGNGNNEGQAIHAQPVFSRIPPLNSTPLPSSKLSQTKQQAPSKLRHADSDVDEDEGNSNSNNNTDKRKTSTKKTTTTTIDQDVDMMILPNVKSGRSLQTKPTSSPTMTTRSKLSALSSSSTAAAAAAAASSIPLSSTISSNNPRPVSMMQRRQSRRHTRRRSSTSSSGASSTDNQQQQQQHQHDTSYSILSTKAISSSNTAPSTDISSIDQTRIARDLYNWLIQQGPSTVDQHTKSLDQSTNSDATAMDMDTTSTSTSTSTTTNTATDSRQSSIRSTPTHFLFDSLKPIMPIVSLPTMTGNWQPIEDDNELSSMSSTSAAASLASSSSSSSQGPKLNAYTCISPGKNGERPRISFLSPIENHCWSLRRSPSASPAPASPSSMHSIPTTSSPDHGSTTMGKSIDESTIAAVSSDSRTSDHTINTTTTKDIGIDTTLNHLMDVSNKRDGIVDDIEDSVSSDLQRYLRIDVEVVSSHLVEGLPK